MLSFSKGSTIEIYEILNDGIKVFTNFNIFGVISSIQVCQLPVSFFIFDRFSF